MASVRILHTADWHIGAENAYLGPLAAARQAEMLTTVRRITDLCTAQSVNLLLIAGDLFDNNHIDASLIGEVFALLGSLIDTKVVIAAGNHDPLSADSPYQSALLPKNCFVLGTKDSVIAFPEFHCRVYGKSFAGVYCAGKPSFSLKPPADDMINLMVLHGETRSDYSSCYCSITKEFIASCGMDYLALGHIHQRSDIHKIENTFFSYSGCPEGQGYDESGIKGVYMGEVEKGFHSLAFVPIAGRTHHCLSVPLTEEEDPYTTVMEAIKATGEHYTDDLFRITLTGALPDGKRVHPDRLAAQLASEVYHLRLRDETTVKADWQALANEPSLKGLFVKACLEKASATHDEQEKKSILYALELGLRSFEGKVKYGED